MKCPIHLFDGEPGPRTEHLGHLGGEDRGGHDDLTGGAVGGLSLLLAEGNNKGCEWSIAAAAGPDYVIDLTDPTTCFNVSNGDDFSLSNVTMVQVGITSSGAGSRTLTVTDIDFVESE